MDNSEEYILDKLSQATDEDLELFVVSLLDDMVSRENSGIYRSEFLNKQDGKMADIFFNELYKKVTREFFSRHFSNKYKNKG